MFGLSIWEVATVLLVALLVLGPQRMPAVIRSLSKALRALQRTSSDVRRALAEPLKEVREPLDRIRDDVYETVGTIERELNKDEQVLLTGPDPVVKTANDADSPVDVPTVDAGGNGTSTDAAPETDRRPPKAKA